MVHNMYSLNTSGQCQRMPMTACHLSGPRGARTGLGVNASDDLPLETVMVTAPITGRTTTPSRCCIHVTTWSSSSAAETARCAHYASQYTPGRTGPADTKKILQSIADTSWR